MSYNVIATPKFSRALKKLAKKYDSLKTDFAKLLHDLEENPESGVFLGNSCYKIRLAISSKNQGKSGGARVITYVAVSGKIVYLLTIYDKSSKVNISDNELKELLKSISYMK